MFLDGFNYDVYIVNIVLFYDEINIFDYLGVIGLFFVFMIFDILFLGFVVSVIVGYKNGEFILNFFLKELEESEFDLIVVGIKEVVNMVEVGVKELDEEIMLKVIMFVYENIKKICEF